MMRGFPLQVNAVSNGTHLVVSKGNMGGQLEIQVFIAKNATQVLIDQIEFGILGNFEIYRTSGVLPFPR